MSALSLAACGTGTTDADDVDVHDDLPQTLEEAAERFRSASFKVTFAGDVSGSHLLTYAHSAGAGGRQRLDMYRLGGTISIFDGTPHRVVCASHPRLPAECRTPTRNQLDRSMAVLISFLDANALARGDRFGILDVADTQRVTIFGRATTCFSVAFVDGEDEAVERSVTGLTCFEEDGIPLRIGIEGQDGPIRFTANGIGQPIELDFVPPAPVTD
jgi:hypothetical protein